MKKDQETKINEFDLATKSVSARANEGGGKNKIEQIKCRIKSARVKESSGENDTEQNKSRVGSLHAKRICGENNTEKNLVKVDIDPTTLETARGSVIRFEKDLTESKMMVNAKVIVRQNESIVNKKLKAEVQAPEKEVAEATGYCCYYNHKNKERRTCKPKPKSVAESACEK